MGGVRASDNQAVRLGPLAQIGCALSRLCWHWRGTSHPVAAERKRERRDTSTSASASASAHLSGCKRNRAHRRVDRVEDASDEHWPEDEGDVWILRTHPMQLVEPQVGPRRRIVEEAFDGHGPRGMLIPRPLRSGANPLGNPNGGKSTTARSKAIGPSIVHRKSAAVTLTNKPPYEVRRDLKQI